MTNPFCPPVVTEQEKLHLGKDAKSQWLLDPDIIYLNHGSFGAPPQVVLDAQSRWRERMETHPIRFLDCQLPGLLRSTADKLGAFLGTTGEGIGFVENATSAVNAVLRSFPWKPGDQLLFLSHVYGAVRQTIYFLRDYHGVEPVEVTLPFPISSPQDVIDTVEQGLTDRTRLLVIDHITSATGLILPIEKIIPLCHEKNIRVLVDGAHAPGMLPLDIDALQADYYVGTCHKWLFAPKGGCFLHTADHCRHEVHPAVISFGYPDGGYAREFDWTGTKDPTAFLSISESLDYFAQIPAERRREYNKQLCDWAAHRLAEKWHVELPAPDAMRPALATIPLPVNIKPDKDVATAFRDNLYTKHQVEVPVFEFAGRVWLRISAQAYNTPDDYERLADSVVPGSDYS